MNFKRFSKWILTYLSVFTMVVLPVSQGLAAEKQAEAISKANVQNAIYEMGLNKSMTYGEFFKKNKDKYPVRLQKELAPYFSKFKNELMPQFDVASVKGADGINIPTLRISQNGQLNNIQIFGEEKKYLKFNNTTLTESDLVNFDDMLTKLSAGDIKLRQQLENTNSEKKTFNGFPEITKKSWTKLNAEQRAGYVIAMRLLYNDAHGVLLSLKNKSNMKKTGKKFSILNLIFENQAQAVPAFEPVYDNEDASSAQKSEPNQGLDSCLVAGYVTKYKGTVCKYSNMKNDYKDVNTLAGRAFNYCGNKIACNPLVFGTPNGTPICIDRKNNADVQRATHYEGPCERGNHTNSKIDFLNDEKDQSGRYTAKNLKKSDEQIKAEALSEQQTDMFKSTRDYISGILKFKDPTLEKLFTDKTPDEKTISALLEIKKSFDSEIKQATEACKSASRTNGKIEKNFWGACDQLQRRFIFVQAYLDKNPGCKSGNVSEVTLKCPCDDGSEVIPGGICKAAVIVPPVLPPIVVPPLESGGGGIVNPGEKCDPACSVDEECKLQAESAGIESYQCVNKKSGKPVVEKEKKKNRFGKFLLKALPWVVGAGVLVGLYYLWKPKKVNLNPAGDLCPDGSTAPCQTQCVSPKVFVSSVGCACAACPPGQTITNAVSCLCGIQSNNVKIVCADGVTIVDDIKNCPQTVLYTCWDGTKVENAINCPEKPATKTESGTSK